MVRLLLLLAALTAIGCRGRFEPIASDAGDLGDADLGDTNNVAPGVVVSLSAAQGTSCAVFDTGELWCWGSGVIDAQSFEPTLPRRITTDTDWIEVATGERTQCARKRDRSVWCFQGQLAVRVGTDNDWDQIDAGDIAVCGLRGGGQLWCWGDNQYGLVGDGTMVDRASPTLADTSARFKRLSMRSSHACAIDLQDHVWCWGENRTGAIGNGVMGGNQLSPLQVGTATWRMVSTGAGEYRGDNKSQSAFGSSCGIQTDGSLWCWGSLGDLTPTNLEPGTDWTAVEVSDQDLCATKQDQLYCRGSVTWGALGTGELRQGGTIPLTAIEPGHRFEQVSMSGWHTCAVRDDVLACTGANWRGQLGRDANWRASPGPAVAGTFVALAPTPHFGSPSALSNGNRAMRWGESRGYVPTLEGPPTPLLSRLVTGNYTTFGIPMAQDPGPILRLSGSTATDFAPGMTWKQFSGGHFYQCGVASDDAVWCWGSNNVGQLGIGTTMDASAPVRQGPEPTRMVSVNLGTGCAVRTDDSLWCWGSNSSGQIGDGTTTARLSPVQVGAGMQWQRVSTSVGHTCALRTDGDLYCWGSNSAGAVGDANPQTRLVPNRVSVGPLTKVATGRSVTCGIGVDGSLWCWGANRSGELGVGDFVQHNTPTRVGTQTDWLDVGFFESTTCGIRSGGALSCWGDGFGGNYGDLTSMSATYQPVAIP